jgi:hypothetical protein
MKHFVIVCLVYLAISVANAQHIGKFEISEIRWNGEVKTYNPSKKFEFKFTDKSDSFFIDSIKSSVLFGRFIYQPIYNDTSERPAFEFVMGNFINTDLDIIARTDFKPGKYDAGMMVKDKLGERKWTGKLRYLPDTSVHLARPAWRKDNFTLQIETFRAWNAEADIKGNNNNKVLKDLYFQGSTGNLFEMRSGGKYGNENFYFQLEPIRYQWGLDVWTELLIHLYKKQTDGQYLEVLAHTFKSTDKNIFYNGVRKQNAYEIRDAKNKYYMMFTGVLIIPY